MSADLATTAAWWLLGYGAALGAHDLPRWWVPWGVASLFWLGAQFVRTRTNG